MWFDVSSSQIGRPNEGNLFKSVSKLLTEPTAGPVSPSPANFPEDDSFSFSESRASNSFLVVDVSLYCSDVFFVATAANGSVDYIRPLASKMPACRWSSSTQTWSG